MFRAPGRHAERPSGGDADGEDAAVSLFAPQDVSRTPSGTSVFTRSSARRDLLRRRVPRGARHVLHGTIMRLYPDRSRLPRPIDRYAVGDTGLRVSPFCLGTVGDPSVVPSAYDVGVNFFFVTADMHWPHYEATRDGLRLLLERRGGIRDDIVVGVVSYVTQPEFSYAPFYEALQAIPGLDRIDVMIIGGAYSGELSVRAEIYARHRRMGLCGVRGLGCSFHQRSSAVGALNDGTVDVGFIRYNARHTGAEKDVFPHLRAERSSLCFNFTSTMGCLSDAEWSQLGLGPDYWRPHPTDTYRWVLRRPEVDGILCSLPNPRAADQLAAAMDRGPLDEVEVQYLTDLGDLGARRAELASEARAGAVASPEG
jgi:hypothetical protein